MFNETAKLWNLIDNLNGQILNLAMKEVRSYPNGPYNFEFANELTRKLANLNDGTAYEWYLAFEYANGNRSEFIPISSASYDIEEFLEFVKEVRGW